MSNSNSNINNVKQKFGCIEKQKKKLEENSRTVLICLQLKYG